MSGFGLTLTGTSGGDGYVVGTIQLGDATERVLMSTEVWSADDYMLHWKEAAAASRRADEPILFCSDYTSIGCAYFAGRRDGDNIVFEEWVLRPSEVAVDGHRVRYLGEGSRSADASHWPVPLALIEAFACEG